MAQWQKAIADGETYLWSLYKEGIDYQNKLGLRRIIPQNVDFYEGRQWPAATEATKNLPRPVINIVKMICRSKKSSILATPVKILYKAFTPNADLEKLNSFCQSLQKEFNQEGLDKLAIDDGIKKGSYFYHYYWDKNAISPSGYIEGDVRCEIIDPLNIFFSNPCELDEQKQRWILIASSIDPSYIYEICDEGLEGTINPYEEEQKNGEKPKAITLLTRYYRINGEVFCERATKFSTVNKPFRLSPRKSSTKSLYDGVKNESNEPSFQENFAQDSENSLHQISKRLNYLESLGKKKETVASLYPIVCGYYERREGSIYGISEVEGIIPNQKAINFNIAMSLLNAQQCAWGKYIALPNALKGQKISNSPGQVLIDYSGTGNGIKRMSEEALSQVPMSITDTLTELTRTATGSSEILSGDALSSNMSGVAIAQLQAQAEVPIEELRSTFWEVKKKQGLVLAQFIRLYYYDKEFVRTKKDELGNEYEICDRFSSKEYENVLFDVVVEPTRGTKASIASDINMLDTCLKNGSISLETYVRAYPEGAISNKSSILKQIEAEKQSEISKLRKELEMSKNSKTVDPVSII
ncbi:MAG: hypothetical protein IJ039_05010 [Clostridia bacterium]|nr:hypothetical protein [Clostridia bacterium]